MHLSLEDTKEEILAVRKTAKHISPHLHNALEIVYVTDGTLELGVSKFALSRVFSGTFHRNFNQYLNDVRINYACFRLENTADTITEIYLDSGFESQRTFNRVFKERFGITPGEYRKRVNYGERHDTIEP